MNLNLKKVFTLAVLLAFLANSFGIVPLAQAQDFRLPAPGVMVHLSPPLNPPILKGIKVHPDNPFRFDFILDKGDSSQNNDQLKDESTKLIKYFLASLTIPEKDLWVNLSPYEKDRIIPNSFGLTEMGRDLLAEDYMLKQITASLIYPEDEIGKKFWSRVYTETAKRFGNVNIPVNTFNKVWIVPQKAVVYENAKAGTAYVVESKLKVMLEQDYLSLQKHEGIQSNQSKVKSTNQLGSQIVREIVIPELTKEVNEDKNFARLRQVYNSLILATWYKKKIKDSILEQVYEDKNKVAGVNVEDPQEKERIYQRYLRAFKKGVYNFIKEEPDPVTNVTIPKKYFSGGFALKVVIGEATPQQAMVAVKNESDHAMEVEANITSFGNASLGKVVSDHAMLDDQTGGHLRPAILLFNDFSFETIATHNIEIPPSKIGKIQRRDSKLISDILRQGGFIDNRGIPTAKFDPDLGIEAENDWGYDDIGGHPLGEMMGIPRRYSMLYTDIQYALLERLRRSIPPIIEQPFANSVKNIIDEKDHDTGIAGQLIWPILVRTPESADYFLVALRHPYQGRAVSESGYSLEYELYVKIMSLYRHNGMDHHDYRGKVKIKLDRYGKLISFEKMSYSFIKLAGYEPWLPEFITDQLNALKDQYISSSNPNIITTFSGAIDEGPKPIMSHELHNVTEKEIALLLNDLKNPQISVQGRFTDEEIHEFTKWLTDPTKPLLPQKAILKKFLIYMGFNYTRQQKSQLMKKWYRILARRWLVLYDTVFLLTEYLNRYLKGVDNASEDTLEEFMQLVLSEYQRDIDLKRQFNYIEDRSRGTEAILEQAVGNIKKMKKLIKAINFKRGKTIVRADIPDSEYFFLIRSGSWESPFGIELDIGKKGDRQREFSGKICKIGIDTDGGDTLRIVNTQGIKRMQGEPDQIAEFADSMGIKPTFLLYLLAVEFARHFGFSNIVAVTAENLPHKPAESMNLVKLFKQFGINKHDPIGYSRSVTTLMDRWEIKAGENLTVGHTIEKTLQVFSSLLAAKQTDEEKNPAMKVENGGIDLTPANMNLQTQNKGGAIKFYLDPVMLKQLQDAPGFVPVIINIQPLVDIRTFLGLNQQPKAQVIG